MAKKKTEQAQCSFCGRPADMAEVLVPSAGAPGVYICSDCVETINGILHDYKEQSKDASPTKMDSVPKPKEIYDYLNQYVIGQDEAKNILPLQSTIIINALPRIKMMMWISKK